MKGLQRLLGVGLVISLLLSSLAQEDNSVGNTITVMIGASSGVEFVREAAEAYMSENPGTTVEVLEGRQPHRRFTGYLRRLL